MSIESPAGNADSRRALGTKGDDMASPRVEALCARLEKGGRKTQQVLGALTPEQWERCLYPGPPAWTVRDLLAHFVSTEAGLRQMCQVVASGGQGAPAGFDIDDFNAQEQARLKDRTPAELLADLANERQRTLDWIQALEEGDLDRIGRHPALGTVSLETMVTAIYGHQLLHMRDLQSTLP